MSGTWCSRGGGNPLTDFTNVELNSLLVSGTDTDDVVKKVVRSTEMTSGIKYRKPGLCNSHLSGI